MAESKNYCNPLCICGCRFTAHMESKQLTRTGCLQHDYCNKFVQAAYVPSERIAELEAELDKVKAELARAQSVATCKEMAARDSDRWREQAESDLAASTKHLKVARERWAEWTPLRLAVEFHVTYERLASQFNYTTRTETRIFDPESSNGKLMIAVCGEILRELAEIDKREIG